MHPPQGFVISIKACSHEPGTVNYPAVMIAPGQVLPHIHMMICCPGATLPQVSFIALGQVHRHLITTNLSELFYFLHKLLQRMNFKHIYLFLVLSGTFYWEILIQTLIMSMCKTTLAPGNFCVLFTWRKITSARRVTQCCTTCNPPLEVTPGQLKTHVNDYRRQTVHRGKVVPGVSELSWDHVMRPLVKIFKEFR